VRLRNTVLFLLALGLLFGGTLSGGDKKPTKTKGQLPPGYKKLNLSDEQKTKIFGIQASYRKQVAALKKQLEDLQDKQKEEVFNVLTRDQKAKLVGAGSTDNPKDKAGKDKKDK
jgi:Spy/CpxP family protein refolding chaperone